MGLGLGLIMVGMLLKSWVGEQNKTPRERFPNPDDLCGVGAGTNHGWDASDHDHAPPCLERREAEIMASFLPSC